MNTPLAPLAVRLAKLRESIHRAFADVSMPDVDAITGHDCEECAEIRAAFAGQHWRGMPDTLLEAHYSDLPLFSAQALPFFLPAFLLYSIQHFSHDSQVTEHTIYHLTPRKADHDVTHDYYRARMRHFTDAHMEIVNEFLQLVRESEDFRIYLGDVGPGAERLNDYWQHR